MMISRESRDMPVGVGEPDSWLVWFCSQLLPSYCWKWEPRSARTFWELSTVRSSYCWSQEFPGCGCLLTSWSF